MNSSFNKISKFNFPLISQLQRNFKLFNESGNRDSINVLFCDIQDKYIRKIANHKELIQKSKVIAEISKVLKFNQIVTEQKKDVFGITIPEITANLNPGAKIFEKTRFSMFTEEEIEKMPVDDIYILLGIESHICVYQTALNFIKKDRHVILLADAVSSSSLGERKIAIDNLREMGCYITTCQGLVFLMLQDAKDENFTSILKNLRELSAISCNILLDKEEGNLKF